MADLHRFDPLTDFCMECGLAAERAVEFDLWICKGGNSRDYLLARSRLDALVRPILEEMGLAPPKVIH